MLDNRGAYRPLVYNDRAMAMLSKFPAHTTTIAIMITQRFGCAVSVLVGNNPQAGRGLRLLVAGPSNTVPSAAKREPCSGQSHDFSRSLKRTTPPR